MRSGVNGVISQETAADTQQDSVHQVKVLLSFHHISPFFQELFLPLSPHWLRLCSPYLIRTGPDCVYWNFQTYKNESAAWRLFGSEQVFIWWTGWHSARGVIKVTHFVHDIKYALKLNGVMQNSKILKKKVTAIQLLKINNRRNVQGRNVLSHKML